MCGEVYTAVLKDMRHHDRKKNIEKKREREVGGERGMEGERMVKQFGNLGKGDVVVLCNFSVCLKLFF